MFSLRKRTARAFRREMEKRPLCSIDQRKDLKNLATGYWVYEQMLESFRQTGWFRFAPGFKAGVYGRERQDYCIKVMGMGVGEDPLYFCERGYYLAHEREMLQTFRDFGFQFLPRVMSLSDSVEFLVRECGLEREQAELRCKLNDVMITEHIRGVPLAVQTGHFLDYSLEIDRFSTSVLFEMTEALTQLKKELARANKQGLLHNDPMPPNILFTAENGAIAAKLVDFELAQNLRKKSPSFVNDSVQELYRERDVPRNTQTGQYTTNLDLYLMEESITLLRQTAQLMQSMGKNSSLLDAVNISLPFLGFIQVNLGKLKNGKT